MLIAPNLKWETKADPWNISTRANVTVICGGILFGVSTSCTWWCGQSGVSALERVQFLF